MPEITQDDLWLQHKCSYCDYKFKLGDYYIVGTQHAKYEEPGAIYCSNRCFNGYLDEFRRMKKRTTSWRKKQTRKHARKKGQKNGPPNGH